MRLCKQCQKGFEPTKEDYIFYEKISPSFSGKKFTVPPPSLCPDCRQQRRLSFRNQMKLYQRECALCHKKIISMYSADKPYTVYCPACWWSDKWDPMQYGRDFDGKKSFFEQFNELKLKVPHLSLHVTNNENSEYVNLSGYNKDCYLVFAADYNGDCLYGTQIIHAENCIDTLNCLDSQHCYEVVDVENCYQLFFSNKCKNCSNSMFLYECKNCSDCLFCTNLRNKQYHIFNKPYSKEDYQLKKKDIMAQIASGQLEELQHSFEELKKQTLHKDLDMINCENCLGDYLSDSKNLYVCFDLAHAEDCRHTFNGYKIKDVMDVAHATEVERAYEGTSVGYNSYNILFANGAWSSNNCYYVDNVHFSSDLFGCVGLKKKKYCILNKQYTKEEYEKLVSQIIEYMQKTKEWGEFFPVTVSPFGYNETRAYEYFPLTQEEVGKLQSKWKEEETRVVIQKTLTKLTSDIRKIPDSITKEILNCAVCTKNFKIVLPELNFYKKMALPPPQKCPECRHKKRRSLRNPRKLWTRTCTECGSAIKTTFAPERPEKVCCEKCYLKKVY